MDRVRFPIHFPPWSHLLLCSLPGLLIHPVQLVQGHLEGCTDLTDHLLSLGRGGSEGPLPPTMPWWGQGGQGTTSVGLGVPFPSSLPSSPGAWVEWGFLQMVMGRGWGQKYSHNGLAVPVKGGFDEEGAQCKAQCVIRVGDAGLPAGRAGLREQDEGSVRPSAHSSAPLPSPSLALTPPQRGDTQQQKPHPKR